MTRSAATVSFSITDARLALVNNDFSRESMRRLAEKTDFTVVRWETYARKTPPNWFYNCVPVGDQARALLRRSGA